MSEQFKVGDLVVGQHLVINTERNGMLGEVVGGLKFGFGRNELSGQEDFDARYTVMWADGVRTRVLPHNLRKRRPPSTDESDSRQAMLDCIERARRPVGVPA